MGLKEAFIEYQKALNKEFGDIKAKLNAPDCDIIEQTPSYKVTMDNSSALEVTFSFPLEVTKKILLLKSESDFDLSPKGGVA